MTDPCPVGRHIRGGLIGVRDDVTDATCDGPRTTHTFYREQIKERLPYGAWQRGTPRAKGKAGTFFRAVALDVTEGPKMNERENPRADRYWTREQIIALFTLGRECPACGGRGRLGSEYSSSDPARIIRTCPTCHGTGTVGGVCERHIAMLCPECDLCGERGGHSARCSVVKHAVPETKYRPPPALTLPDKAVLAMLAAQDTQFAERSNFAVADAILKRRADRRALLPLIVGGV